jgi:uncharacterized protein (DUF4415 family)
MLKTTVKRSIRMPSDAENREILRGAKADSNAKPLTASQLKRMVPIKSILGRPKLESPKQLVSIRYSQEVLEYFRSSGAGWQSRIDGVLKTYVEKQSSKAGKRAA